MNPQQVQQMQQASMPQAAVAASAKLAVDAPDLPAKTYVMPVPGAMFIMPNGDRHQFKPVNRVGHLTTTSAHVQAELDAAIKRGSQISVLNMEVAAAVIQGAASPAERAAEAIAAANGLAAPAVTQEAPAVVQLSAEEQQRQDAIAAARAKLLSAAPGTTTAM